LRAQGEHPAIEVIKDYGQLPLVNCYANQLNQVFMNILSNAIDALETQPAPRMIFINTSLVKGQCSQSDRVSCAGSKFSYPAWSLVNRSQQQAIDNQPITTDFVVIQIADNGSGMSEDVIPKIFDPFFTTKLVGSGTGLGLSVCYEIIVEKHNGHISCVSAPNKGTEFIVKIPVRQEHLS
jgi:signal transduction histidine kinase